MVEPFASVVYNTLLSGRPRLTSVVRTIVTTSTRNGVGCDFFTPSPRRAKGKNKLEDVHQPLRDWSSSDRHLLLWPCMYRTASFLLHSL